MTRGMSGCPEGGCPGQRAPGSVRNSYNRSATGRRRHTAAMAPAAAPDDLVTLLHTPLAAAVRRTKSRVDLCSPYLGAGTAVWLAAAARRSKADWTLLTVLDPVAAAYGSLSLDGLRGLLKEGVAVRHAAGLHAKVFLVDDAAGWAGSANLTAPGLGEALRPNLELTVALSPGQVAQASRVLRGWRAAAKQVTPAMLDECQAKAALVPVRTSAPPGRRGSGRAAAGNKILEDALDAGVWVKAVYQDAARADEGWGPGSFVTSSKRGRPSFAVHDLLLVYAKGAKICNAVLEVDAAAYIDRDEQLDLGIPPADADRWPWITHVTARLHVPSADGVQLEELGLTGQSLQGGHCRMPTGGLAAAVRRMTA